METKETVLKRKTRHELLRLRLVEGTKSRLDVIANRVGLPATTLATYAVGEWLAAREAQYGIHETIVEKVTSQGFEMIAQQLPLIFKMLAEQEEQQAKVIDPQ